MIKGIYVAKKSKAQQIQIDAVQVDFAKGIVGDRNYGKKGDDGPNITFVESEEIAAYNAKFEQCIADSDTRRNILTQGVRLNDLVGREFSVGGVRFYGVELCEPCAQLGYALANESMTPPAVLKTWLHKGGLRANVLSSGVLRVGMAFNLPTI